MGHVQLLLSLEFNNIDQNGYTVEEATINTVSFTGDIFGAFDVPTGIINHQEGRSACIVPQSMFSHSFFKGASEKAGILGSSALKRYHCYLGTI